MAEPCPCGSGAAFADCCGRWLEGGLAAPTAEALMRSRYTAYVRGAFDYLARTWHPKTRPPDLGPQPVQWLGLTIVAIEQGGERDQTGTVEFKARYTSPEGEGVMHERSRFQRVQGAWCYLDGQQNPAPAKVGRNDPCPCGSGKKYKKCCG